MFLEITKQVEFINPKTGCVTHERLAPKYIKVDKAFTIEVFKKLVGGT